ncbi:MAG: hypothetical protein ABIJ40_00250 [Bacteroidota bacterium]|nr:hypothetical protein [bacterium]MBU1873514.1 hypothetical protein [bacterium]
MSEFKIAIIAGITTTIFGIILGFIFGFFSKKLEIRLQTEHATTNDFRNIFIRLKDNIIRGDFGDDNSIGTFIINHMNETNLAFEIFIASVPKYKQRRIYKAYNRYKYPRGENNFHTKDYYIYNLDKEKFDFQNMTKEVIDGKSYALYNIQTVIDSTK